MEDDRKISAKEVYLSTLQLVMHSEATTWNRFYNFLMGNSILILAWATIFASKNNSVAAKCVMLAICILGAISGIAWAALGYRGREFVKKNLNIGANMEKDVKIILPELNKYNPLTESEFLRDYLPFPWSGSLFLLTIGPLSVTVLYMVLGIATFF